MMLKGLAISSLLLRESAWCWRPCYFNIIQVYDVDHTNVWCWKGLLFLHCCCYAVESNLRDFFSIV